MLNAITWCFHEEFTGSFKKKSVLLNDVARKEGKNFYSVLIRFDEGGKSYSVKRTGGSFPGFTVHENMSGDQRRIESAALFINSIIPKDMWRYFFIDGEAQAVTVDADGQISAERSIKDILGFQVAEKTLSDLALIKKEYSRKIANYDIGSELEGKQRQLSAIIERMEGAQKDKESLVKAKEMYKSIYDDADNFLKASNHAVVKEKTKRRDGLESQKANLIKKSAGYSDKKIRLVRKYSWVAFADTLRGISLDSIDEDEHKGTIPAPFNETLVRDILKAAECICGARIEPNTEAFSRIQGMLRKAADPDLMNRLGRARSQLHFIESTILDAEKEIIDTFDEIQSNFQDIEQVSDELLEIMKTIGDVDDQEIKKYEAIRDDNYGKIEQALRQIGAKSQDIDRFEKDVDRLTAEVQRLAVMSPMSKQLKEKENFVGEVEKVIKGELEDVLASVGRLIEVKMNDFMLKHLKQNHKARITPSFKVGLYDEYGNLAAPGGGHSAMLSLIYISTLIAIARDRSGASGAILTPGAIAPIIIDAPFSHLDNDYAPRLARALPANAPQLVIIMYEGNAKGGDSAIREDGKVGREYYLSQHINGGRGAKENSYLTVENNRYLVTEYEAERDQVKIEEIV